jgi:hypothetical protein
MCDGVLATVGMMNKIAMAVEADGSVISEF